MTTKTEELWQDVHDGLRAFVAKRVNDQGHVDDILQDVFVRAHRQMETLNDPHRVVSWIYQITRNAIIDYYRHAERRREIPAGLSVEIELLGDLTTISEIEGRGEEGKLRTELADCLKPMIERLARDYRDAIALVELEGLTQQAAAERMGISLSGMKSRVQRGRKQLKQMLEDCCLIELDRRGGVADYRARTAGCDSCVESKRLETTDRS